MEPRQGRESSSMNACMREPTAAHRLRVLIVDDSRHFRSAAQGLFEMIPRIGPIATASSGEAALALLEDESFDLMVLDLSMDGIGGLEVARRLRGCPGAPKIVMVSLYDEPEF